LNVYVSPFGKATNNGLTPQTPVESVDLALSIGNMLANNTYVTINVAAGSYLISSGIVFDYDVTIQGDGTKKPTFTAVSTLSNPCFSLFRNVIVAINSVTIKGCEIGKLGFYQKKKFVKL
jgi:hypothetical protein